MRTRSLIPRSAAGVAFHPCSKHAGILTDISPPRRVGTSARYFGQRISRGCYVSVISSKFDTASSLEDFHFASGTGIYGRNSSHRLCERTINVTSRRYLTTDSVGQYSGPRCPRFRPHFFFFRKRLITSVPPWRPFSGDAPHVAFRSRMHR